MKKIFLLAVLAIVPALVILKAQGSLDTIFTLDNKMEFVPAIDPEEWSSPFKERIGMAAMPFDVIDYQGNWHSSKKYLGKIIILYFWNIWDWDSCEKQTAALNKLVEKYGKKVKVVSFVRESIGSDETEFLQKHLVSFPIVPDSYDFAASYHGNQLGTPLLFLIDGKGYWRKIGRDLEGFERLIEEL
ncbi:MAG: TlpA disulfide reductase family protein [Bacteroidota bacterium]